ncbi:nucleolar complex-associated protein 3 [Favolaschia claudopus]|uniref:Nucleolar complex-associated protein 3 n=1 Tax=Favolaschia claudopus TaxID=2862362 RepID=A0AAW0AQV9_9AGAR
MAPKTGTKRSAPPSLVGVEDISGHLSVLHAVQAPSKKRKLAPPQKDKTASASKKYTIKPKEKGKEKAADRGTIPIPVFDEDLELSDQDLEVLQEYGGAASFLGSLDQTAISRSKKETERLRQLNKPTRKAPEKDDLPSLDSHDEEEDDWSSDLPSDDDDFSDEGSDLAFQSSDLDSDAEMPYEIVPRNHRPSWESPTEQSIEKLPIKLPDGRIQKTGVKLKPSPTSEDTDDPSDDSDKDEAPELPAREDVSTGARFGRPAVVDVVSSKSRATRIQAAKDQIAGICQEIVADPENSLGLLRRLHTFSLAEISTPTHPEPVENDVIIRKLAILSQLAVFKDIIPGYRIRSLTEKEQSEKVSQMVARTRDWEQGLVAVYQTYLRSLEGELKAKSELASIALNAMCTLLVEQTHFNFRVNLMSCIIARLSRKSWDKASFIFFTKHTSDQCLDAINKVFRADLTGEASLEIVRLLNRMIKERRFNVHPTVLSCLLRLRLKTELGVRASESHTDKLEPVKKNSYAKDAARRAKGKPTAQPHLSKKARKALKEKQEIDREFREAEAEVDKEQRAATHTETLKLLFVLYFKIIKNPHPTPLLSAALHGISKYAHLVNIDFFKDLLKVLKELVTRDSEYNGDAESDAVSTDVEQRLQCIVTAFELLSGQGEALNIDLSDFGTALYALILPLSLITLGTRLTDMLFRALDIVFSPRTFGAAAPPWRAAAFAKRLLTASLHWPSAAALRSVEFVNGLLAKDPKLSALLSTEERALDGTYRPDVDDPQLCNPLGTCLWELVALGAQHWDPRVRAEAQKVIVSARE